jgi:hypothetical protein
MDAVMESLPEKSYTTITPVYDDDSINTHMMNVYKTVGERVNLPSLARFLEKHSGSPNVLNDSRIYIKKPVVAKMKEPTMIIFESGKVFISSRSPEISMDVWEKMVEAFAIYKISSDYVEAMVMLKTRKRKADDVCDAMNPEDFEKMKKMFSI